MINRRHGGPYDRGMADVYYHRDYNPHYYVGPSYSSKLIEAGSMTPEEIEEYRQGYQEAYEDRSYRKTYD